MATTCAVCTVIRTLKAECLNQCCRLSLHRAAGLWLQLLQGRCDVWRSNPIASRDSGYAGIVPVQRQGSVGSLGIRFAPALHSYGTPAFKQPISASPVSVIAHALLLLLRSSPTQSQHEARARCRKVCLLTWRLVIRSPRFREYAVSRTVFAIEQPPVRTGL